MSFTLFHNARVYTHADPGRPLAGAEQGRLNHWPGGAVLCREGLIEAVGPEAQVRGVQMRKALPPGAQAQEIDCRGACLIPGLVDPHTHLCFTRTREEEFTLRLGDVPYLEILARGGGILSSVRDVRAAGEEELLGATLRRARAALALGTTTMEIKSGYGLSTEQELRALRLIAQLAEEHRVRIVPTFLGAHEIPRDRAGDREGYLREIVEVMIPAVASDHLAEFCDDLAQGKISLC